MLLAQQKTNDCALLEIQKTYASSLLLVLQAASDMSAYLTPSPGKDYRDYQIGIKSPLTKLKDSLSLVCKVSQSINQFHRNLVLLPAGEKAEELTAWLFEDSVSDSIDALEREQTVASIEGEDTSDMKYPEQSTNFKFS